MGAALEKQAWAHSGTALEATGAQSGLPPAVQVGPTEVSLRLEVTPELVVVFDTSPELELFVLEDSGELVALLVEDP